MEKRRTFSRAFKLAAVKKMTEQGLSFTSCRPRSWRRSEFDSQMEEVF